MAQASPGTRLRAVYHVPEFALPSDPATDDGHRRGPRGDGEP